MDTSEFQLNVAVVIGINDYQNNISQLSTARQDAESIARLLETEYQYEVILITDTTEIQPSFEQLHQFFEQDLPDRIQSPQSTRLIFYFAGHGIAEGSDRGPAGYLIPQNAKLGDVSTYLSMQFIHDSLSRLSCHHLLVILDCCFGGAFRWANSRHLDFIDSGKVYKQHYEYFTRFPAWQVITSAAHDQKALDLSVDRRNSDEAAQHSPFALALLEGLGSSQADLIRDGVITTHELYVYLRDHLTKLFGAQQTPGIWPLKPDYDRGEFIFTSSDFDQAALADAPPIDTRSNPYRGLKSFEERHADLFFGREALVTQLFDRLSRPLNQSLTQDESRHISQRLLIVLGVSGSGKSSLVKAGLLPKLRSQVAQKWCVLTPMRPGRSPFSSLAQVILPIVNEQYSQKLEDCKFLDQRFTTLVETKADEPINPDLLTLADTWLKETSESKLLLILNRLDEFKVSAIFREEELQQLAGLKEQMEHEIEALQQNLQATPQYLTTAIQSWHDRNPTASLVLVIDQLEELVTMMPSAQNATSRSTFQAQIDNLHQSEWWKFLEVLRLSLENTSSPLHIVLTLRSDFEPRFYKTPLQDYWKEACFYIDDMSSEELRLAIEKPALKQAIYFDPPGLVSRLVDDVRKMPGALPLLSFTLSELHRTLQERWRIEKSTDRALRNEDYEGLGGVTKSLANRATQEYENLVQGVSKAEGERLQGLMRQVLRRMVSLDGGGARRRVLSSELTYPNDRDNQAIAEILKRLVDNRLVVAGQDGGETYYEPAHDSLVVHWIREWMTPQAKEELALQRLLTPAAREWQQKEAQWIEQHRLTYSSARIWHIINYFCDWWEIRQISQSQKKLKLKDPKQLSPKQFLWDTNPRLNLLKKVFYLNSWFNQQEFKFVQESVLRRRKNYAKSGSIFCLVFLSLWGITSLISQYQKLKTQVRISSLKAENEFLLNPDSLDSLIYSLQAQDNLNQPLSMLSYLDSTKEMKTLQDDVTRNLNKYLHSVKESNRLEKHQYDIFQAVFMPDGESLLSAGYDGKLRYWGINGELLSESQEKHESIIRSLSISSDSKVIATGHSTGYIKLWKIEKNKIFYITEFKGNQKNNPNKPDQSVVKTLAFHPKKRNLLISSGYDGLVKLWNIEQLTLEPQPRMPSAFQPLAEIKAHSGKYIQDTNFSSDGEWLTTAGTDSTIRVYEFSQITKMANKLNREISPIAELCYYSSKNNIIRSVQFNPRNRQQLLTSDRDGSTGIWNLESHKNERLISACTKDSKPKQTVLIPAEGTRYAGFSPNGNQIVTTSSNGIAQLWDLNGRPLSKFVGHYGPVYIANFNPKGNLLATAGQDGTVRLWKWSQNFQLIDTGLEHGSRSTVFNPASDGKELSIAGTDGTVQIWRQQDYSWIKHAQCEGHKAGVVFGLSYAPNNKLLASSSEDGTVRLWDLEKGCQSLGFWQGYPEGKNFENDVNKNFENDVNNVSFSPTNGNLLAAAIGNGKIQLWDLKTLDRAIIQSQLNSPVTFQGHSARSLLGAWNIAFSPNGKLLATTGSDGAVRIWDVNKIREKRQSSLTESQNLQQKNSSEKSKIEQTALLSECFGHQQYVEGARFHPTENILATSDSGGTIILWNLNETQQGKCNQIHLKINIKQISGDVYGIAFSPNGKLLAVGNADGTARIWDMAGNLVDEFPGHEKIYGVAFTPDSKTLAVTDKSKTVRLWKTLESDELLSKSCDRVKDYLQHNPNASEVRHICDGIGSTPK
jgi:WD40 repeat protein